MSDPGKPLFDHLQYCIRCCMPETQEGLAFDEFGMCRACQSSEQKMHIDWVAREKLLRKTLEDAKAKAGDNYDCLVPISGGKDSTFQLYMLTRVYGMKPLAVTFNHNWYSETGWYNLINSIETFGVDHMMFTPSRQLVNRLAKRSISAIGDTCWHCHAGVGAYPLHIAVKFNIPLLIWGESIAESSGRASYDNPVRKFDREYFLKVSAKRDAHEMVCGDLSSKDLYPFKLPTAEECEAVGLHGIHLGDYIFWDDERQTEFVRDNFGWRETEIEGTYKGYKSAECIMPGMHDFTCFLKRGFGRASFHASVDVRAGLLTREEGFEMAKSYDTERPQAMDYYCEITGQTEQQVMDIMKAQRVEQLKDVELPIKKKNRENAEVIRPFAQRLVEKYRGKS